MDDRETPAAAAEAASLGRESSLDSGPRLFCGDGKLPAHQQILDGPRALGCAGAGSRLMAIRSDFRSSTGSVARAQALSRHSDHGPRP